ncbi:MAG TPA: hypothetical protein PLL77_16275, partial [Pyrinomonadaceae bacterium]|nr:hypothetical protein [Pyrinomonadaceae bacterium]
SLWLAGRACTADATSSARAEAGNDARSETASCAIHEAVIDATVDAETLVSGPNFAIRDAMSAADDATFATADTEPSETTAEVLEVFIGLSFLGHIREMNRAAFPNSQVTDRRIIAH